MSSPNETHDAAYVEFVEKIRQLPTLHEEAATVAFKNLKTFSESRISTSESELTPEPTTVWGKFKLGTSKVWDNETTRTLIKAGGALAGVALVTYSTIQRDHVVERQALAQANQRNS